MSSYYEIKSIDEDDGDNEDEEATRSNAGVLNIFESLPHALREILFELNAIFADLKTTVAFDQNILVNKLSHYEDDEDTDEDHDLDNHSIKLKDMCHDSNNKFMSYLLVNSLILGIYYLTMVQGLPTFLNIWYQTPPLSS